MKVDTKDTGGNTMNDYNPQDFTKSNKDVVIAWVVSLALVSIGLSVLLL